MRPESMLPPDQTWERLIVAGPNTADSDDVEPFLEEIRAPIAQSSDTAFHALTQAKAGQYVSYRTDAF